MLSCSQMRAARIPSEEILKESECLMACQWPNFGMSHLDIETVSNLVLGKRVKSFKVHLIDAFKKVKRMAPAIHAPGTP